MLRLRTAGASIIPRGPVVNLRRRVEAGEYSVSIAWQLEIAFDDERGVGEIDQVIFRDAIVFDGIANDTAKEGDVRAGANLAEEISDRRCAREARVHGNHFCVPRTLRFDRPLEPARMILGRITAHD